MLSKVVTVGSGVLDTLYDNVIDIISVYLLPLAESSVGWHTYILLHDAALTTILLASFGCVIITYRVCLTQTFYRLDLRITYTAT